LPFVQHRCFPKIVLAPNDTYCVPASFSLIFIDPSSTSSLDSLGDGGCADAGVTERFEIEDFVGYIVFAF